jgi:hypothetical protein
MLNPAELDELADKPSVTKCDPGWTAVPSNEMVTVGLVALLVIVTVPFKFPAANGAKVTFKTAEPPAAKIKPDETPLTLTPAPERVTFAMEMLEPPTFVSVTVRMLLLPTERFP